MDYRSLRPAVWPLAEPQQRPGAVLPEALRAALEPLAAASPALPAQ